MSLLCPSWRIPELRALRDPAARSIKEAPQVFQKLMSSDLAACSAGIVPATEALYAWGSQALANLRILSATTSESGRVSVPSVSQNAMDPKASSCSAAPICASVRAFVTRASPGVPMISWRKPASTVIWSPGASFQGDAVIAIEPICLGRVCLMVC